MAPPRSRRSPRACRTRQPDVPLAALAAVVLERAPGFVKAIAVDLDHQPLLRPIHQLTGDEHVAARLREGGGADQLEEAPLELGLRARRFVVELVDRIISGL